MSNKITKILSLFFTLAVLIVLGSLAVHFHSVKAENIEYEIGGWLWTENYGWISLSSDNHQFLDDNYYYSGPEYGLKLNGDNVSGWAWSSNVGWICFGSSCDSNDCGSNAPNSDWSAKLSQGNRIIGWAQVVSLCDDGWIHLGLGNSVGSKKGVDCYDCKYEDSDDEDSEEDSEDEANLKCKTCFTETKFNNVNISEEGIGVIGGSGNICFDCNACERIENYGLKIFRTECESCSSCHQYGVARDSSSGELVGWAWGSSRSGVDGSGWINFSGKAGIVYPWLETIYGSVYSQAVIRQKSLISGINATYCLFANDIINFNSKHCNQGQLDEFNLDIKFPLENNSEYENSLGKIDLKGLTTKTKVIGETNYNKYGNIIESSNTTTWNEGRVLNNKVFVINGDLNIDSGFQINNGNSNERGNGLVVVNGNLRINSSFGYEVYNNHNLQQIASVVWVVKGDVVVTPEVEKIVGGFVVLGRNNDCKYEGQDSCSGSVEYPKYQQNGYGVFFSEQSNKQLIVSGLIVAKAFDFRRVYSSVLQGSERIIYDGRLLINPAPGFKAFLENLPLIKN